eukprot:6171910-Pleurochrysis_carterae.AAC.1
MTRPSSGVMPMLVSMLTPPLMHATLAPLPRCITMAFSSAFGFFNSVATASTTKLYDEPWKPYLRTPCSR